jgi:outer membrane protein OmpU
MKKTILLGTTALFAAGLVMGGAAQAAEEPITAGIGGYFKTAMGFVSQDNADGELADAQLSNGFANAVEIGVGGSTTLDNGITAGFDVQLDSAGFDERHVFFSGSFGLIQAGQLEGVRQQMTNFAPGAAAAGFGVNTPHFLFGAGGSVGSVHTYNNGLGDEDAGKINYFSPTFNGFRLGLSYAPDDVASAGRGTTTNGLGDVQGNRAIAAEFSNDFGDFSIRVSAGYEDHTLETCNINAAGVAVALAARTTADQNCQDNPSTIAFGGTVSFGEFAIGGGYLETEQVGNTATGSGRTREDMELGISYASGPMTLAMQYGQGDLDDVAGLTDQLSIYELQAQYVLGPGVILGAALAKGEFDDATAGGLDNDYTTLKFGAHLGF